MYLLLVTETSIISIIIIIWLLLLLLFPLLLSVDIKVTKTMKSIQSELKMHEV